jgi:hypothetical protein
MFRGGDIEIPVYLLFSSSVYGIEKGWMAVSSKLLEYWEFVESNVRLAFITLPLDEENVQKDSGILRHVCRDNVQYKYLTLRMGCL